MSMTNGEKITGIHLKFIYLVKLTRNSQATLSPENLEATVRAGS